MAVLAEDKIPWVMFGGSGGATMRTPKITTTTTTTTTLPIRVQLKEKILFDRLLEVVKFYNLGSTIRVAGGWVRDKLLGEDTYDIDIAIDNMLGRTFADKVEKYLASIGEEVKQAHDIKSNPEKSKHLETSKVHLYGMEIDFVNLRSEDYCQNSRIPTMADLMVSGNDPVEAVNYLCDLDCFQPPFQC